MANGIRTGDPRGFNKGHSSKFRVGSRVRQKPEEGRRTYQPKCCENNNKDVNNSRKILNDKNRTFLSVTQTGTSFTGSRKFDTAFQVLPLWVKVNLEVMTKKSDS